MDHAHNPDHSTMPPAVPIAPMKSMPPMTHHVGAHDRHAGHSVAMFRDRFGLSLLLTLPVLVWSRDIQDGLA
jgi:Cu2+-exporting ATPase